MQGSEMPVLALFETWQTGLHDEVCGAQGCGRLHRRRRRRRAPSPVELQRCSSHLFQQTCSGNASITCPWFRHHTGVKCIPVLKCRRLYPGSGACSACPDSWHPTHGGGPRDPSQVTRALWVGHSQALMVAIDANGSRNDRADNGQAVISRAYGGDQACC